MWKKQIISVILPTYNEKESIKKFIEELEELKIVDDIIVINNNAAAGTSEEVSSTSAREIHESTQGYGAAIQRGFKEAIGDLVMAFEPDGTFKANDVYKLLSYSDDFDIVYGSRTVKELIWHGANMGLFLKWGNYAVAKLMEFLFNTINLTDVGCTVRCIKRKNLEQISPYFTVVGSFFGPEMMLISIAQKQKIVQIPVNYTKRIGSSAVTGNKWVAFLLGFKMIWLIVRYRFRSWFKRDAFKIMDNKI
jgi:glycosyltransferase involved in cell wall biosynthesis